jgi:hypothetical protein
MEPGHLTLAFETPDLAATFGRRFQGIAEQAATELAGHPVKISAVVIGSPPASPPTPPLPAGPPAAAAPGRVQDASGSSFAGPENVSGRRLADKPPSRPVPEPGDTAARPVSATVATASAVPPIQATPPAEAAVDFDVPDEFEDDPLTDGGDDVRALTGVPLVVEMLGAEIIEDTDGE